MIDNQAISRANTLIHIYQKELDRSIRRRRQYSEILDHIIAKIIFKLAQSSQLSIKLKLDVL